MFEPIYGDGGASLFQEWRSKPDRIDGLDEGLFTVGNNAALSVDNGEPVIDVHVSGDNRVRLLGRVLGVDVEKRELELMPCPEGSYGLSNGIVVLAGRDKIVGNEQVESHGKSPKNGRIAEVQP